MPVITASDQPLHWTVSEAGTIIETGITLLGETTIAALTLTSNPDENALMGALFTAGIVAPPMPGAGTELEQGEIYDFGGLLYRVRQSHTRTEHDPAEIPALFSTYRADAGLALDWITGEQVYVGTWRLYDDVLYECLQAHQTQSDWYPSATGILGVLWGVVALTTEWAAGVHYLGDNTEGAGNGDVVTYQGAEYRCQQSHTSQIGWEPPNVPALWIAL